MRSAKTVVVVALLTDAIISCVTDSVPILGEPVPTVASVSPKRVAIEGQQEITVVGTGFGHGSALCRIDPPSSGTTHVLNSSAPTFSARVVNDTLIICMGVPTVVAEGPGLLVVSTDNGKSFHGDQRGLTNRLTYFPMVEVALDRRPYVYEESGILLLRSDKGLLDGKLLSVEAALPAAGPLARWSWASVVGGVEARLPLDFGKLPKTSLHNDMTIEITIQGMGPFSNETLQISKSRRFHRVPPPVEGSLVEVVQVDHTSRGLLINGKFWNGVGWYVSWKGGLVGLARVIRSKLVPRGVNQGMIYGLSSNPPSEQLAFLDDCAAVGFKVMYPLATGNVSINHGGPFNQPQVLKVMKENVAMVKNHPALLGYYICDDCCSDQHDISLQAQAYQIIKDIDPYHVTIGAVNCGNSWMFTDITPSFLTPETSMNDHTLPEGKQPRLQLSLDVVMQENYATTLAEHAASGDWDHGVGHDGFFRHGMSFEPLINCPSPNVGHWAKPSFMLSAAWLGVVTADMYSNLVFVYEEALPEEDATPVDLFAAQVRTLLPALAAPFGSAIHPQAVVSGVDGEAVRARAWSSSPPSNCTFVVVVNTLENRSSHFILSILPTPTAHNATRIFTNISDVVPLLPGGKMADGIAPGGTNVYAIGSDCDHGMLSTSTPEPMPGLTWI